MPRFEPHGTGNASPLSATEGVLLLAAAVETILLAGLVLLIVRVGAGSATLDGFVWLNSILLGPFAALGGPGGTHAVAIGQQSGAVLGYGLFFLLLIGGVSWFDRRGLLS